jgi:hypothetical protein
VCCICTDPISSSRALADRGAPSALYTPPACEHHFHARCIVLWFGQCVGKGRPDHCPLCRAEVRNFPRVSEAATLARTRVLADAIDSAVAESNACFRERMVYLCALRDECLIDMRKLQKTAREIYTASASARKKKRGRSGSGGGRGRSRVGSGSGHDNGAGAGAAGAGTGEGSTTASDSDASVGSGGGGGGNNNSSNEGSSGSTSSTATAAKTPSNRFMRGLQRAARRAWLKKHTPRLRDKALRLCVDVTMLRGFCTLNYVALRKIWKKADKNLGTRQYAINMVRLKAEPFVQGAESGEFAQLQKKAVRLLQEVWGGADELVRIEGESIEAEEWGGGGGAATAVYRGTWSEEAGASGDGGAGSGGAASVGMAAEKEGEEEEGGGGGGDAGSQPQAFHIPDSVDSAAAVAAGAVGGGGSGSGGDTAAAATVGGAATTASTATAADITGEDSEASSDGSAIDTVNFVDTADTLSPLVSELMGPSVTLQEILDRVNRTAREAQKAFGTANKASKRRTADYRTLYLGRRSPTPRD